ncbi:hypothetical protein [Bacillus sp. V3-13]|uniref:hypothetical protein n=1 Tax=Bacillus sp. V3-13 TaxID=2053728 RepID=UPI00115B38AE|nr:hypothetical protein [Bacillus sp. V3-13]
MKRRALTMSFMQVFASPVFYLSIIGVTVLCFISIWERISTSEAGVTVFYSLDIFIGLTMLKKLVVLFAALPYVASFCSDWKCQYIKPVVIRTGTKKYVWSKIITCFVSGLLTVFIGLILFITLLSFKVPLFPDENLDQAIYPPFAPLAVGEFPILFLLAKSFVFSMAAAFWTVVGLAVSAFIPIHFVAIAAPVIASYVLEEMTIFLPNWLNIYLLTGSADVIHQGPLVSIAYFIFIFILFSVLAGLLFDYQVKRRLRNEVV